MAADKDVSIDAAVYQNWGVFIHWKKRKIGAEGLSWLEISPPLWLQEEHHRQIVHPITCQVFCFYVRLARWFSATNRLKCQVSVIHLFAKYMHTPMHPHHRLPLDCFATGSTHSELLLQRTAGLVHLYRMRQWLQMLWCVFIDVWTLWNVTSLNGCGQTTGMKRGRYEGLKQRPSESLWSTSSDHVDDMLQSAEVSVVQPLLRIDSHI